MPTPTAPLAQFNPTPPVGGNISTNGQGVALGTVDPNELTSTQLGRLMSSGNPLVQQSVQAAQSAALARGGGLGGSMVADAATQGAYNSMSPIAQQDAARYGQVADENLGALNNENTTAMNNRTSMGVAGIGASASKYTADTSARTQAAALAQQQGQFVQGHQYDLENQANAQRNYVTDATLNGSLGAIFSDPSYWSNPEAALNMAHTFQNGFDQIYNGSGDNSQAFEAPARSGPGRP